MSTAIKDTQKMIEEVLDAYPEKSKKDRAKHLAANDPSGQCSTCQVKSNIKSRPGVMTVRGCAYAGAKGVVWGPVKDQITVSHGPIGCGQYSWWSRRNYYNGQTGIDTFGTMHITTDFQEKNIVYGGDKGLDAALHELKELFPLAKGIGILSECPVGLIGDDIEAVSKRVAKEFKYPIVPVRCEGFRGVSQSLGHHIANDTIKDYVLGNEIAIATKAKLNLIHCYRSMNYICRHMEEEFGIPWMEFNFFGPTKTYESIRKIAARFDEKIQKNAEDVIAKYKPIMDAVVEQYKPKLAGKKVMLYVGGLRPRHTIGAYEDLGMEVVASGYEFGHSDDYKRTYPELKEGAVIMDDATLYELEEFTRRLKPDMVGSGIKEKYSYHKLGVPFRQMHSWDYSGPYHGFDGFPVFARDMDMTVNSPTWDLIRRKK